MPCIFVLNIGQLADRSWYGQTNSLTEVLFEDALAQAKKLDVDFRATGKLKGPLHGIPITLKDQFNVKGVDTALGYVGRSFAPALEDAALVQILKNMGAIILAKTNLPQSIMVRSRSKLKISETGTDCTFSGLKQKIPFGDSRPILVIRSSRPVARPAEKALCSPCMDPWSDLEPISVEA